MKQVLALMLLPVLAQGWLASSAQARVWTAPEGCAIFMTVQSKSCRVSNHYRCTGDAPGDQWRADFDQDGLFFRSRINSETEWVESIDLSDATRETLQPNPKDPASFTGLIETGEDRFSFVLEDTLGIQRNVEGFDRLTGRKVTIDGVQLEETEFSFEQTAPDGTLLQAGRGLEYISRDMRLFFSGPSDAYVGDDEWLPMDGSPIDFVFEGEKGFGSTIPIYDCDALTAQGPRTPLELWKARYAP